MNTTDRFSRLPEARAKFGISRSGFLQKVKDGDLPERVRIGVRSVAWIESELDEVFRKMAAGASQQEIRDLVRRQVAQRKSLVSKHQNDKQYHDQSKDGDGSQ